MMRAVGKLLMVLLLVVCATQAVGRDTVQQSQSRWESLLNWNFIVVPTVSYQPETNWAFGVAGAYYFNCKNQTRTSDIGFDACYALSKQYSVNVATTTYFNEESHWRLSANVKFRQFPEYLFGYGNRGDDLFGDRQMYLSKLLEVKAMPQYEVVSHFFVGPAVTFRWESSSAVDSLMVHQEGIDPYHLLGLGAVLSYDTRDQVNYTHKGMFLKSVMLYYEPYLGSSYRMGTINIDWRHFVPIYKEFGFAYQFYGNAVFGSKKPFQMLSTTGGMDQSRGIRSGYWRDDVSMMLQAELRIPVWRFLKATLFGSVADVYNLEHWQWSLPKFAYGAGLRVAINKAKVNVRFDVARQTYLHSWSYYLTVREAF